MPRSSRLAALRSALAAKLKDGQVVILDRIELEAPKTKILAKLLADIEAPHALIILPNRDDAIERAARNLPTVKVLRAEGANVYDILRYQRLVMTRDAIDALQKRLQA
jgi:large subunit ribosomal protein L4